MTAITSYDIYLFHLYPERARTGEGPYRREVQKAQPLVYWMDEHQDSRFKEISSANMTELWVCDTWAPFDKDAFVTEFRKIEWTYPEHVYLIIHTRDHTNEALHTDLIRPNDY